MKQAVLFFVRSPRKLFLLDSIGALATALSLFVVRWAFHAHFGIPPNILQVLAAIALAYSLYSASCYLFLKKNPAPFIRIIAMANLLYVALIIGILFIHHAALSPIGLAYFIVEAAIISGLAMLEFKVANKLSASSDTTFEP